MPADLDRYNSLAVGKGQRDLETEDDRRYSVVNASKMARYTFKELPIGIRFGV